MKIGVVTLGTRDLEQSRGFYERFLECAPADDSAGVVYFKLEGAWLALYPRDRLAAYCGVASSEDVEFTAQTLSVNLPSPLAVDRLSQRAESLGARVTRPAAPAQWGGYIAWLADPDGFLWELVWNPKLSSETDA